MDVVFAVEGRTDVPYAEKIIRRIGRNPRPIHIDGGASSIDAKLRRWSGSANRLPMLVIRDLDQRDGVACAPQLIEKLLAGRTPPDTFALRIAERSIESWLMADRAAASDYFCTSHIPKDPDFELHPKLALVAACRRSTGQIRRRMVPSPRTNAAVGIDYVEMVVDFGVRIWDPDRARKNSPSLDRSLHRLEQFVAAGIW